jgi:hypothetical protein
MASVLLYLFMNSQMHDDSDELDPFLDKICLHCSNSIASEWAIVKIHGV